MGHNPVALVASQDLPAATSVSRQAEMALALFFGTLLALLVLAVPGIAQNTSQPIPENAGPKSFGVGWQCNVGFRLDGKICASIILPENAYATKRIYGSGWACQRGYRAVGEVSCAAVVVPDGGYLDASGERWRCLRGFFKSGNLCEEIVLPENAYLAESLDGSSWSCERGFERVGKACTAIAVPANAYLNGSSYGRTWTCDRRFVERSGACVAVLIPKNAFFDDATYGTGWRCERGFASDGQSCAAIEVPANAHLDRSGNRWNCDRNFQRSRGRCVLSN